MNYEQIIEEVAKLISSHEHYQKILGQMAYEVAQEFGRERIIGLAEDVKETHGINLSPKTLQNYEWVYRQTKDLDLPEDLSYRTLQYISSSNQPSLWAKRINEEGLSSAEVYHLIREEKGLNIKKAVICPHCGKNINEEKEENEKH